VPLYGPYGTGFAWLHRDLLDRLRPQQAYWLAMQTGRGLDEMRGTTVRDDLGVRAFDVFCPAAFASTLPWIAALQVFIDAGVSTVADHDQRSHEVSARFLKSASSSAQPPVLSSLTTVDVGGNGTDAVGHGVFPVTRSREALTW
jgi:selenocysteine lyase/cysteine desulfurase